MKFVECFIDFEKVMVSVKCVYTIFWNKSELIGNELIRDV